jgi:hypothetical protein
VPFVTAATRPAGRVAIGFVIAAWVVIALLVILRALSWDAASFLGAGAFTFAVAVVMAFDAVVDWLDPDERGSLRARFRPEVPWPWLAKAPQWLRFIAVPVFFTAGTVTGHFLWH